MTSTCLNRVSCPGARLLAMHEIRVKADFRNANIIKDGRAVSNVTGNHYRLVTLIDYPDRVGDVRFIGSHAEYVSIDAQTI